MAESLLSMHVERFDYPDRPAHHIPPAATWTSYLPSWGATSGTTATSNPEISSRSSSSTSLSRLSKEKKRGTRSWRRKGGDGTVTGFRNPWPSWHKSTQMEIWKAFEWGDDIDPCIDMARKHAEEIPPVQRTRTGLNASPNVNQQQADQLLKITKPDFTVTYTDSVKTTWLGHAGMLVQLPPLQQGKKAIRCLFDPIFSMRCSPSQLAGPIRSYAPPCKITDLPGIDVVMISHSHFDHLDYDSIITLWKIHNTTIRFVVPLGQKKWFIECGIDENRVFELDWWDAVTLTSDDTNDSAALRITCTPAQHGSGRSSADANMSLWSSWHLQHPSIHGRPYSVFFAGDTGYQWHESPGWPPPPPSTSPTAIQGRELAAKVDDDSAQGKYPPCPAFKEIAQRLGSPDLLLLPIAVGATFDYLRSFSPLPDSVNPFPRHCPGVTAHNHMPPWDAVRVFNIMTKEGAKNKQGYQPVAIAMHWGTFVTDPIEVLKTLGQLEWACMAHDVEFVRSVEGMRDSKAVFAAVNHGESIET